MIKKTIYINGKYLAQQLTGVQRYAVELTKAIDVLLDSHEIFQKFNFKILAPSCAKIESIALKNIQIERVGKFKGFFWEQFILPFYVRTNLLLNFCSAAPLIKSNQIVTIHDAAPFDHPEWFGFVFICWYWVALNFLGWRVAQIATDSEFSRKRLLHHLPIAENKIKLIYCGVSSFSQHREDEKLQALKAHYQLDKNYFLFIGSLEPRKNLQRLFQAWNNIHSQLSDFDLVIIGGKGSKKVFRHVVYQDINNIKLLGYLTDVDLKILLSGAYALVYPSLYEGFGLPPLEAMSMGIPVIVSDIASLPEVVGEAALFINPMDVASIANGIEQLAGDKKLREQLSQAGIKQAEKFSWKNSAGQLLDLILKIKEK